MKVISALLSLCSAMIIIGCGTQQKMPVYLQNATDSTGKQTVLTQELLIQKNDMLSIQVYSASTKPEISDALYNLPVTPGPATGGTTPGTAASGYLVDNQGRIEYPRIGILQVEGLTKDQLAALIKRKINENDSVLSNPSVIVRFLNLKITVLGEVKSPGLISFPGERLTILEAIGLSGDISDYGMKDRVKVIRESNGVRETGIINLSDKDLFNSPYYNLRQNDVVLVEASKNKAKKADQDTTLRTAGFFISVITALAVIANLFR